MSDRLYAVQLQELNDAGEQTGRAMHTVLSSCQLPTTDLERLFELVNTDLETEDKK